MENIQDLSDIFVIKPHICLNRFIIRKDYNGGVIWSLFKMDRLTQEQGCFCGYLTGVSGALDKRSCLA